MEQLLDSRDRRFRWRERAPVGNPPLITGRTVETFAILERHGYATSKYLHALVGGDEHNFKQQLSALYDWGYLERFPQQQNSFPNRIRHIIYGNTEKARLELIKAGRADSFVDRFDPFHHRFMSGCIGISLEVACIERGIKYSSRNQVLKGKVLPIPLPNFGKKAHYEPDDLCCFQYSDKSFRRYVIESDRRNEPPKGRERHSSLEKKLDYIEYIIAKRLYSSEWGIPGAVWLFPTTSEDRLDSFFALVLERKNPALASRILGKSYPTFGTSSTDWLIPDDLLTDILEPWRRADGTTFDISVPK